MTSQISVSYLLHAVLVELVEVQGIDALLCAQDQVLVWGEGGEDHRVWLLNIPMI